MNDEDSQRQGVVGLIYYVGPSNAKQDQEVFYELPKLLEWLPIWYSGLHMCYNSPVIRALAPIIKLAIGTARRVRLRMHQGT